MYLRIRFQLFLLLTMLLPVSAAAQMALGFEGEESSSVGIYVKDLKTGRVFASNDSIRALMPASVMKSITDAAAMYALSDDFRFITPVTLQGSNGEDSSSWNGNLVINSCGDPTIDSELFKDRTPFSSEIVSGLKKLGITSISGRIIINQPQSDQGCPPNWQVDDIAWPYGAGWYGFNYNDNYYQLWPATGVSKPHDPSLDMTLNPSSGNITLMRGVHSDHLMVYGGNLKNANARTKTSMNNPAEVFTYELTQKLKAAGISLGENDIKSTGEEVTVVEHKSPMAADMLRKMMHESHNLYAEGFLRAIAPGENRDKAIAAELRQLQTMGVNTKNNLICDGSGLSRTDRVQPKFISDVLEAAAKGQYGKSFVNTFPRAGREGTVKGLLSKTSMAGRFALKSGSMSSVQCYAGFRLDNNGNPTHTVVILVNSFFCPRAQVRAAIEKFLLSIK